MTKRPPNNLSNTRSRDRNIPHSPVRRTSVPSHRRSISPIRVSVSAARASSVYSQPLLVKGPGTNRGIGTGHKKGSPRMAQKTSPRKPSRNYQKDEGDEIGRRIDDNDKYSTSSKRCENRHENRSENENGVRNEGKNVNGNRNSENDDTNNNYHMLEYHFFNKMEEEIKI